MRERILEGARRVILSEGDLRIDFKAVAEAAGVTAAVVSYMFTDLNTLLEALLEPVLADRLFAVTEIATADEGPIVKFSRLLVLGLEAERWELGILACAVDHLRRGDASDVLRRQLGAGHALLLEIVEEGNRAGEWAITNPHQALAALWTACLTAEVTPSLDPTEQQVRYTEALRTMIGGLLLTASTTADQAARHARLACAWS